jgi:hypothetical protein
MPRYAGALAFSPDGILFVGDNILAAVFAYDLSAAPCPGPMTQETPLDIGRIDERIAQTLEIPLSAVKINGLSVHPVARDVYLSLSLGSGSDSVPAIVRISATGRVEALDIQAGYHAVYRIPDAPPPEHRFRDLSLGGRGCWTVPASEKYREKARIPMRSLAIVDMKFHDGALFISGISNEEFCSALRRVPYPFPSVASECRIRIYHTAHAQWESRAPIRAMNFASINGRDMLIAAYTCSPLALIPVEELVNGAKITGRSIGNIGNGMPISMVRFHYRGQESLFVTSLGRGPRVIPIAGLNGATAYTPHNSPSHPRIDTSPEFPLGPVGKEVMFVGSSLRADLLNEHFFVSLTRDPASGDLNLEALPTFPLPMKADQIWTEFDFPEPGWLSTASI